MLGALFWLAIHVVHGAIPLLEWGKKDNEISTGLSLDIHGNMIVCGCTTKEDKNNRSGYVVKYSSAGQLIWRTEIETMNDDCSLGIDTDGAGNIYVVGYTSGDFESHSSSSTRSVNDNDIFISKINHLSGQMIWTKQFGTDSSEYAYGVVATDVGVFVSGFSLGSFTDPNIICPSKVRFNDPSKLSTCKNAFVMKLTLDGHQEWVHEISTTLSDRAYDIAAIENDTYVIGQTYGQLERDSNMGDEANSDLFLIKLDATTGQTIWSRQYGSSQSDLCFMSGSQLNRGKCGVLIDGNSVYLTGMTTGYVASEEFGHKEHFEKLCHSKNCINTLIVKFTTATGATEWSNQLISRSRNNGNALALGPEGSVFVLGSTDAGLTSDPGRESYFQDAFLVSFDSNGHQKYIHQFGSPGNDFGVDLAISNSKLYTIGYSDVSIFQKPGNYQSFLELRETKSGESQILCPDTIEFESLINPVQNSSVEIRITRPESMKNCGSIELQYQIIGGRPGLEYIVPSNQKLIMSKGEETVSIHIQVLLQKNNIDIQVEISSLSKGTTIVGPTQTRVVFNPEHTDFSDGSKWEDVTRYLMFGFGAGLLMVVSTGKYYGMGMRSSKEFQYKFTLDPKVNQHNDDESESETEDVEFEQLLQNYHQLQQEINLLNEFN